MYEVSKKVKLTEAEKRVEVARGWMEGKMGSFSSMSMKLQLSKINFEDLLYNIVPIDNNMALHILKMMKRINLMLSILIAHA